MRSAGKTKQKYQNMNLYLSPAHFTTAARGKKGILTRRRKIGSRTASTAVTSLRPARSNCSLASEAWSRWRYALEARVLAVACLADRQLTAWFAVALTSPTLHVVASSCVASTEERKKKCVDKEVPTSKYAVNIANPSYTTAHARTHARSHARTQHARTHTHGTALMSTSIGILPRYAGIWMTTLAQRSACGTVVHMRSRQFFAELQGQSD